METFRPGEVRDEWVPLPEDTTELEAARKKEGWRELSRDVDQNRGQWHYRWRYAPDQLRAENRRDTLIGGAVLLVVPVLIVIGVVFAVVHRDRSADEAPAAAAESYGPVNSEGKPAVGPFPAPPDDPCWRQTEEAVEISPEDGGQSAMPQRCIDKGF